MERELITSIHQVETEEETKNAVKLIHEHLHWANIILQDEFGFSVIDVSGKHERDMEDTDIFKPPPGRLLIAYCSNELAGIGCLRKIGNDIGEVKRMYIRPKFRRRGIGRKVIESLITEAIKIGYSRIRLDSARSNKEAYSLYRSLGFEEIEPYNESEIPEKYWSFWVFMEKLI